MSNPTDTILLDMGIYIARREQEFSLHMTQGIPDYAFALDLKLRRRLDMIKPLRYLVEALQSNISHQGRALYEANGIAVGPSQFPHLHEMGVHCARILGIGIPQIFITPDPAVNAWTFATGDVDQLIIPSSVCWRPCSLARRCCLWGAGAGARRSHVTAQV